MISTIKLNTINLIPENFKQLKFHYFLLIQYWYPPRPYEVIFLQNVLLNWVFDPKVADNSNNALNLNFSLQESIGPIQDLPEEKSQVAKGVGSETQGINLMASSIFILEF